MAVRPQHGKGLSFPWASYVVRYCLIKSQLHVLTVDLSGQEPCQTGERSLGPVDELRERETRRGWDRGNQYHNVRQPVSFGTQ